jgi:hypothetical protein
VTSGLDQVVIWQLGQEWRDLRAEVLGLGDAVTVVSRHGTARVLSPEGWQLRVPLEGGHRMHLDDARQPLATIDVATPCGVHTTDGQGRWHATTRLILVLRGAHPDWLRPGIGRDLLEASLRGDWEAPGHPTQPCGAVYCPATTTA